MVIRLNTVITFGKYGRPWCEFSQADDAKDSHRLTHRQT